MLLSTALLQLFFAGDVPEIMLDVDKQVTCMNNALDLPENNNVVDVWNYLLRHDSLREDACTWRGVECNDSGVITHFILTARDPRRRKLYVHVCLSWLPNTIAYIHMKHVLLHENFVDDVLPKDLRYFYLRDGRVKSLNASRIFNTKVLPAEMEELVMQMSNSFFGTVHIPSLPPKMVLCSLTSLDLKMAIVDNGGLPRDLKQVVFCGSGTNVVTFDGSKVDKRVGSNAKGTVKLVKSMYADTFAEKSGAIEREVMEAIG